MKKNFIKPKKDFDDKACSFGLLLIDGMSGREEVVCGHLDHSFVGLPIVGGSAGDDFDFEKTFVLNNGRFKSDCASLTIVTTTRPFELFKSQHFKPTDKKIIITDADPDSRLVSEINGEPAAASYARILNIEISDFTPAIFSKNPLIIKIGGSTMSGAFRKLMTMVV